MMTTLKALLWKLKMRLGRFPGSQEYWEKRYAKGGNSGPGSYTEFAEYKAKVMNRLIAEHKVATAIEFGCGDGNQLAMIQYPNYHGLDVSLSAVERCKALFRSDHTKRFSLYRPMDFNPTDPLFRADLGVSMDVLFHLVEQDVFETYLTHLFASAERLVVIYARDVDGPPTFHERNRAFTKYIGTLAPGWRLKEHLPSPFKSKARTKTEAGNTAEFFVFAKQG